MSDWQGAASGLPEPCAGTTRTHGSEGRGGQRCPSLTRPCTDPQKMLEFLRGRDGGRKLRLYACAYCRGSSDLIEEDEVWGAVEVAERYAEG
jgi:hypothetical protein